MDLSPTGDSGESLRDRALRSRFQARTAKRARLRSTRNRLHIRSLRRSLRASAREATRDSSRDVRDGPDLFGGRPGAYPGPHRLRAVVPRSSVLVTDGQMRRLDSPRASPSRDAPVEPLGVGRALSPESVRASLEEDSWRSSTALLRKRAANPLTKSCKYWPDVPPADYDFRVSRSKKSAPDLVNTRGVGYFSASAGILRSNCRAS